MTLHSKHGSKEADESNFFDFVHGAGGESTTSSLSTDGRGVDRPATVQMTPNPLLRIGDSTISTLETAAPEIVLDSPLPLRAR